MGNQDVIHVVQCLTHSWHCGNIAMNIRILQYNICVMIVGKGTHSKVS